MRDRGRLYWILLGGASFWIAPLALIVLALTLDPVLVFGHRSPYVSIISIPAEDDMTGPAPALSQAAKDLSGTWSFTHFDDRFQGWIALRQSGSTLQGTWHTSSGKSEPDTLVTGSVEGTAVTLRRSLGQNQQSYSLTLSADGKRLDGFGEGYFLHHTNLNMTRSGDVKPAMAPPSTTSTAPSAKH